MCCSAAQDKPAVVSTSVGRTRTCGRQSAEVWPLPRRAGKNPETCATDPLVRTIRYRIHIADFAWRCIFRLVHNNRVFTSIEEGQLNLRLGETIRCRASYEIPVVNLKKADNHVALEILITIYHWSQIMREFVKIEQCGNIQNLSKKFKFACTGIPPSSSSSSDIVMGSQHSKYLLKIFTRIGSDQNCIVVSRDGIKGVVSGR